MGFDYEVFYKHDKDNIVINALSRRYEEVIKCQSMVMGRLQFAFIYRLRVELVDDIILAPPIVCLLTIPDSDSPYLWRDALLWYKGQSVLSVSNEL